MLTIDRTPAAGTTGALIPIDGVAEVMTFRDLDLRLHTWAIPAANWVWWQIDDHTPDTLVEVVWHVRPSGARYDVAAVHPLTH
jgi:hypothetical protein